MRPFACGAVAVSLLTLAPLAFAGTASVSETTVSFVAAVGETNHVIAAEDSPGVRIIDLGASIVAGAGCAAVNANEVFCPRRGRVNVAVGDLNDFVLVTMPSSRVTERGGDGDDALHNGRGDSVLLSGGPGDDTLDGGAGFDRLRGGLGDDVLRGRAGRDIADYSERTAAVSVDLDGVADDGEAGEADTLIGIEEVVGGAGDDVLTGDRRSNSLVGRDGADTLNGLGGVDDLIFGDDGNDRLNGGPGFDDVSGGDGSDLIRGGPGGDFASGGKGRDSIRGGPGRDDMTGRGGADTLFARDGMRDRLNGGTGTDRARIDRRLDRLRSIEQLF